jgi:hypothetical protein
MEEIGNVEEYCICGMTQHGAFIGRKGGQCEVISSFIISSSFLSLIGVGTTHQPA